MKCLMIKADPISDILDGVKTIEYRSWPTKYRGDIFIGCSANRYCKAFLAGVVTITDCIFNNVDQIYEWHLDNVRGIKPIPIQGRLRLFETGIDTYEVLNTEEEVEQAYKEAQEYLSKGR